jgi:hypothetical protein
LQTHHVWVRGVAGKTGNVKFYVAGICGAYRDGTKISVSTMCCALHTGHAGRAHLHAMRTTIPRAWGKPQGGG